MSKVKVAAMCGEATATVVDSDFVHTSAPGVFLDVFQDNGHVICEVVPDALGKCDYKPDVRFDVDFSSKEDSFRLLQNLRDAIDATLALNTYMEKGEGNA